MGSSPTLIPAVVPGSQVSAVTYGKPVADDINTGVVIVPFCHLRSLVGTTYPSSASPGDAGFITVVEDSDGMSNIATSNHIFIRTSGRYTLLGQAGWLPNGTGPRGCLITKNGTGIAAQVNQANAPASHRIQVGITDRFIAGDELALQIFQTSGISLATTTDFGGLFFQALFVGS